MAATDESQSFSTDIPARMDRLPWSRWHWMVVLALGITWIIDGLEVTLVGAVGVVLKDPKTLHFRDEQIGLLGTAYLVGAVLGALGFGYLTDRLGRKKLFSATLGLYLVAAFATAFSWDFWSFAVFRFLTGAGIGGEYAAINSAIDELIPARLRGRVDLAINGTFWAGSALGYGATFLLLDPRILPIDLGWRLGFGIGAAMGLGIIFLRHHVPESPRWLLTHGRREEAETIVDQVEQTIEADPKVGTLPPPEGKPMTIRPHGPVGFLKIAHVMLKQYGRRTVLGLAMIGSQAFLYNGVAFTLALVLEQFYEVPARLVGLYLLPFTLGNLMGPLVLGHFFDTIGRRPMIMGTYLAAAVLLAATGGLFYAGMLTPWTQVALWAAAFFFASAAASSAYLTVSEIFPLELRGMAIALFYSAGTAIGGTIAPWLFGNLIGRKDPKFILYGDLATAAILALTAVVVAFFGVKAERASLEDIAPPLSLEGEGAA